MSHQAVCVMRRLHEQHWSTRKYLEHNRFWLTPDSTLKPNFVNSVAGRAYVPDSHVREFFMMLVRDCITFQGTWNELISPTFRLFVDLDMRVRPEHHSNETVLQIMACLQRAVRRMSSADNSDKTVHIFVSAPKPGSSSSSVAFGVHATWPRILVEHTLALEFRHVALMELQSGLNSILFVDSSDCWSNMLDERVYRPEGGGLRLPNNAKGDKCADCKTVGNRECKCRGIGRCSKGRPYLFLASMNVDGSVDSSCSSVMENSLLMQLVEGSIRCPLDSKPSSWFVLPSDVTFVPETHTKPRQRQPQPQPHGQHQPQQQPVSAKGVSVWKGLWTQSDEDYLQTHPGQRCLSDTSLAILENVVRGVCEHWRSVDVVRAVAPKTKQENQPFCWIVVAVGEGEHWCSNKQAVHNTARIYFILTSKGIAQRCMSCKTWNGLPCKQFKSQVWPVPDTQTVAEFDLIPTKRHHLPAREDLACSSCASELAQRLPKAMSDITTRSLQQCQQNPELRAEWMQLMAWNRGSQHTDAQSKAASTKKRKRSAKS